MGDKTQFAVLALSTRFRAVLVLGADLIGITTVHIVGVSLGAWVTHIVPPTWIKLGIGLMFTGFGILAFRYDKLDTTAPNYGTMKSPFWVMIAIFGLAELGDKTMLATLALAANYSVMPVLIGMSAGVILADAVATVVGNYMGKQMPLHTVRVGAGIVFLGVGIWYLVLGGPALSSIFQARFLF